MSANRPQKPAHRQRAIDNILSRLKSAAVKAWSLKNTDAARSIEACLAEVRDVLGRGPQREAN